VCSEAEKLREKSRAQKREGGQLAPPLSARARRLSGQAG
jgi:hypothetical protein